MNLIYVLVIWTTVGLSSGSQGANSVQDWRPIGEFKFLTTCQDAAKILNLKPEIYRCISTGK